MKHGFLCKALTVLLAFSLAITNISVQAFAQDAISETELPETEGYSDYLTEQSVADVVSEDDTRRERQSKHFRMSDGSCKAVLYSHSVHYQENGSWKDIDNTLEHKESSKAMDHPHWENGSGPFSVGFADKPSESFFRISTDEGSVSWGIRGSDDKAEIKLIEQQEPEDPFAQAVARSVSQKVTYQDILPGISLEYTVNGDGVKENIIISNSESWKGMTYAIELDGLYAEKKEDGRIVLSSSETKEEVFELAAPYMYDSNEEIPAYSDNVSLNIVKTDEDTWDLTVEADEQWLKDPDRVYPVIIDPVITTKREKSAIDSTFVSRSKSDINYKNYEMLCVGWDSYAYGEVRTFIRFDLPELNKGDVVIDASLSMYMYEQSFLINVPDQAIEAMAVTGSWSASTLTWNNMPSYDSEVYDYDYIHRSETSATRWKDFDITEAVKKWYEGELTNYGLVIKKKYGPDDGGMSSYCAYGKFYSHKYDGLAWPQIIISYRNNKGLEDMWSYTTLSAGSAGVASVNEYTGNLVFQIPLMQDSNELMSFGLSMTYNTYCAGEQCVAGKNGSVQTYPGKGFRLNVQQTLLTSDKYGLTGVSATNWPYVYADGDGTEHYIQKVTENGSTVYKDEDGLGYTLEVTNDTLKYLLKDKNGNTMAFYSNGNLARITDNNGHYTRVVYCDADSSSGINTLSKIDYIRLASGHKYQFIYDSAYSLSAVQDSAGRTVSFTKDSDGYLTGISYPDGTSCAYTYGDDGVLTETQDADNYKLMFEYSSSDKGRRVELITEKGETVTGQKISFDYSSYNETVMETCGLDGIFGNDDDLITTYQFDDLGRTVNAKAQLKNGHEAGAALYRYTTSVSNDSTMASKNKISTAAGFGKNVLNLVSGGGCENDNGWGSGSVGTVTYAAQPVSDIRHSGEGSLKLQNTAFSSSGYSYYRRTSSPVTSGKTYTLSAYVRTDISQTGSSGHDGAYLKLVWKDSANNGIGTAYSSCIRQSTEQGTDEGWRRLSVTSTASSQAVSCSVYLCFNGTGTAYYDDVQLEEGEAANSFNLIRNSGFESADSGWNQTGSGTMQIVSSEKRSGASSLNVTGDPEDSLQLYQIVKIPDASQDDTYIVSGWAKGEAVSQKNHTDSGENKTRFEIGVKVRYLTSNNEYVLQAKDPAEFNTAVSSWQYTSSPIVLQYKNPAEGVTYSPVEIRIYLRYMYQENTAYFDDIQLIKDAAQSYTYDEKGNMISVTQNAQQKNQIEYNGNSDLTKYTDAKGSNYTYTYDDNHNLLTATSARGIVTAVSYDTDTHNVTDVEVRNYGNTMILKTGSEYNSGISGTNDGAYLTKQYDQDGNYVSYAYNFVRGRKTSVTDARNHTTSYTYMSADDDRIKSVTASSSRVTYSYSGNLLSSITFLDTSDSSYKETYSYSYDAFGNKLQTSVGSQGLVDYHYASANGYLDKMTYGNGDEEQYVYDELGNVVSIRQKEYGEAAQDAFKWTYDSRHAVKSHSDLLDGKIYTYCYDSLDRLIRQDVSDPDGQFISSTEYSYDVMNNVTAVKTEAGGRVTEQQYSFSEIEGITTTGSYAKDNLPTRYSMSSDSYLDYKYDTLNRMTGKTLTMGNESLFYNYVYKNSDRNEGSSTLYKTTLVKRDIIGDDAYNYEYDENGNITSIKKGRRTTLGSSDPDTTGYSAYRSYEYDELNELIRENNITSSQTVTWDYDALGNVLSRTEYPYTASDPGTPTKTVSYRYGNDGKSGWNYLLTAVDLDGNGSYDQSETITYDDIGNPLTYLGASLSWYGRQLTSYSKAGEVYNYTYGSDGLRTSKTKTVSGVTETTEYLYVGDLLVYEKRGSTDIWYYYDSLGNPTSIKWNDGNSEKTMYLTTNVSGDVVGLYSDTGSLMVRFEYDAWGNIISEVNGAGNTLNSTEQQYSDICPFRYRGYYLDKDTGLYYLQNRYYDTGTGRFISADDISYLGADGDILNYNLFAYCQNNPVNRADDGGNLSFWNKVKLGVGAIAFGAAVTLTVLTGGAVAIGVAKIIGSVLLSTAASAVSGYMTNGREGFIDGACNGFMFGSLTAFASALNRYNLVKKALSGTPNSMGEAGEKLAGIKGPKESFWMNNKLRIPDQMTRTKLIEVKNVKYISNTKQLKDYAEYAYRTGRTLILYIRPNTQVANTVIKAGWKIRYLW